MGVCLGVHADVCKYPFSLVEFVDEKGVLRMAITTV